MSRMAKLMRTFPELMLIVKVVSVSAESPESPLPWISFGRNFEGLGRGCARGELDSRAA